MNPFLLTLACSGSPEPDDSSTDDSSTDDSASCGTCPPALTIQFDKISWPDGEYHFLLDLDDIGVSYECVAVVPLGTYTGSENCPANEIGMGLSSMDFTPTSLELTRADFSAGRFGAVHVDPASYPNVLAEQVAITPSWGEDGCGCTTSPDVEVDL
jgi:hypothetical protein